MNSISIINPNNLGEVSSECEYDDVYGLASIITSESWAPGRFNNLRRNIPNFTICQLLVLDVDEGCSIETAKDLFKEYKHIIATSRSHGTEKNGVVCDRFRVVLFLDSTITNDRDFKATWATAFRRWPFIDQACKDSSRFFYPSPEIVSINEAGREYNVSIAVDPPPQLEPRKIGTDVIGSSTKGDLWKSTLEFLLEGAPPGQRHTRLVQAVGNLREQGYTQDETLERLQEMSERVGDPAFVDMPALKTVERMYAKPETKYPFQPKQTEKNGTGVIVTAGELLEEMFEYLADKDKVKGDPTGIDGLDKLLGGGTRTGELTVLMAEGKTGKNTLLHDILLRQLSMGHAYGYASRELNPAREVMPNLTTLALKRNAWKSEIDEAFKDATRSLVRGWAVYFAPGYGYFPLDELETWFRQCKDMGVNHFIFDHFHYALLKEDHEATTTLIKKLKALTKELDIHIFLIVQPRGLKEGEKLSPATLRGGSSIGQALDNLLIFERVKGETNISKLTLETARHKLAELGHVHLLYNPETTEFVEVDRRTVSQETPQNIPRGATGRNFPRVN